MKKIFITCFFIILTENCFAQQVTFQKTFGKTDVDRVLVVEQTMDGGYIFTGDCINSAGDHDTYLIKTNAYGDSLWTKTFDSNLDDFGSSVQQTTDGGYIIAGETHTVGGIFRDVYLIKTDSVGNLIWTKTFGGAIEDQGWSVKQTTDGGYIITGNTSSFGAGNADIYLIKTDANGDTLWTKTFGGTDIDYGFSVQQTTDGGYIITGLSNYYVPAQNGDVCLIKTDSLGNILWSKNFGGINRDYGNSVQQTTDGGYIIGGYTNSFGAGDYDAYLIKTDANGNLLWSKTFGGTGEDYGWFAQQTMDGGYIITGWINIVAINFDIYLVKTDGNGNLIWSKTIGGTNFELGYAAQQTIDGGFVIACMTMSFGAGNEDAYLIKTDSVGNSGCNESSAVTIVTTPATQVTSPVNTVTSPPTIVMTPATIVGSGGTVTTLCTSVGIQSAIPNSHSAISISPNPTANNFTITFPNIINKGIIEIYNVLGKKVFEANISNTSQKEIHLNNTNAGIYFVKVMDGEKGYTQKLVVQ